MMMVITEIENKFLPLSTAAPAIKRFFPSIELPFLRSPFQVFTLTAVVRLSIEGKPEGGKKPWEHSERRLRKIHHSIQSASSSELDSWREGFPLQLRRFAPTCKMLENKYSASRLMSPRIHGLWFNLGDGQAK